MNAVIGCLTLTFSLGPVNTSSRFFRRCLGGYDLMIAVVPRLGGGRAAAVGTMTGTEIWRVGRANRIVVGRRG